MAQGVTRFDWEEDDGFKPAVKPPRPPDVRSSVSKIPSVFPGALSAIPETIRPAGPKSGREYGVKGHSGKMKRKARAEFIALRSRILKPLEGKIKSLEDEIISSEARMTVLNEELVRASAKGGLGAIRRSELSRELKELAEKIDSRYVQLDATTSAYDDEKRKFGIFSE